MEGVIWKWEFSTYKLCGKEEWFQTHSDLSDIFYLRNEGGGWLLIFLHLRNEWIINMRIKIAK